VAEFSAGAPAVTHTPKSAIAIPTDNLTFEIEPRQSELTDLSLIPLEYHYLGELFGKRKASSLKLHRLMIA